MTSLRKWLLPCTALLFAFGIAPFVVALLRLYPVASDDDAAAVKDMLGQWSSWGQMFGFLAAIFSGAALMMMVRQLELQREELKLQRQELGLTRDELKRTATAQENAERALAAQANQAVTAGHLNAAHSLASYYAGVVATNPGMFDREYESAKKENYVEHPASETSKGKMLLYLGHLEAIFQSLKLNAPHDPHRLHRPPFVSSDAKQMFESSVASGGPICETLHQTGTRMLVVNRDSYIPNGDRQAEARWAGALEELLGLQYIEATRDEASDHALRYREYSPTAIGLSAQAKW